MNDRNKYPGTKLLASTIRNWWIFRIITPIEKLCIDLKITPNQLTIFGFLLNCFAALAFFNGQFFIGGLIIIAAGNFDFLDGRIARMTGQESKSGAYLDSVIDRYTDAILFLGLAGYYQNSAILYIIMLAMIGSFSVSYTKAKAEAMNVSCNVGMMQRPERILYLGSGAILSSFVTTSLMPFSDEPLAVPHYFLIVVLAVICIFSNYTAIQRIVHTLKSLSKEQSPNS